MSWMLGAAIYFIVWWMVLFAVLPFGLRTQGEEGDVVPGTPASAPARFSLWRVIAINTVVATVVFAIVWSILTSGWVELDTLPPQMKNAGK